MVGLIRMLLHADICYPVAHFMKSLNHKRSMVSLAISKELQNLDRLADKQDALRSA